MSETFGGCVQRSLVVKAQPIVHLLPQQQQSVVTAESCTAGLIAAILAHAQGADECLHGGFIASSKQHESLALGADAAHERQRQCGSSPSDGARGPAALRSLHCDCRDRGPRSGSG
jgi:hypothetical protein